MEQLGILVLLIMVGIGIRVIMHFVDKERIEKAALSKGWRDVNVTWQPFAPGWFFEKNERHYLVSYRDEVGNPRSRYCKTSLFTGVYWKHETG